MRRRNAFLIAALTLGTVLSPAATKPKLVVVIVIDQFRYDYLARFRKEYTAGLAKLLTGGAVFHRAFYQQAPTVTAIGHSIVLSGAMPSVSGIVGNTWYDRTTGTQVTSVCDSSVKLLGAPPREHDAKKCEDWDPASPRRMLVSTVGDELRNRDEGARVIGVSFKARSAILPSGHRAQGAFWFDDSVGGFVSSTYYSDALPAWVTSFNARKSADKYVAAKWPKFEQWDFHGSNPTRPYDRLAASPWGNELIEGLAESALEGEKLGQRGSTDILTVSFSANDYVGHQTGPDSAEVHDMCLRTDQLIGKLIAVVEARMGLSNTLFVLTADHGAAPMPAAAEKRKMPGGYLSTRATDVIKQALDRKFGAGDWLLPANEGTAIYINWLTADEKKINRAEILRSAAEALLAEPKVHAARVYTRDQLIAGIWTDPLGRAVSYGFNPVRGADIVWVQEPFWVSAENNRNVPEGYDKRGTNHSTPYNYDTHVPVIFYGAGVAVGQYWEDIAVNDIAPTVSAILAIEPPSGSSGKVLGQVLRQVQGR